MGLQQEVLMFTTELTQYLMYQEVRETDGLWWKKAYTLMARQVMSGFQIGSFCLGRSSSFLRIQI